MVKTITEKMFGKYRDRPHVKERINQRARELTQIAKELGLCTECQKNEVALGKTRCTKCLEYHRNYNRKSSRGKEVRCYLKELSEVKK